MAGRLLFLLFITFLCRNGCIGDRGDYIGCYRLGNEELLEQGTVNTVDECLDACESEFYRYSILSKGSTCYCGKLPGKFKLPLETCSILCAKNESQKCGDEAAVSVYDTEVIAPGRPASVTVLKVTETTVRLNWTAPKSYTIITGYIIQATVVNTYANINLDPAKYTVSNGTFFFELQNLHPGSLYNISIAATNNENEGPNITTTATTIIGTPDPSPPNIKILERKGNKMLVHIPEATNINGPVSLYRIVVSIEMFQQGFQINNLGNYSFAKDQGLSYYITAELDPDDIVHDFIIGDESTYNGFYNAPLELTNDISVSLGVVSEKDHVRKVRYAESTKKIILNINEPEEMSPMVVALGAGIAIGVVLLLIGVGLLIILRKRIHLVRVQRGSQSMPLNVSEPCLEIENAGFLQEDEQRVDYYGNLKRQLWNIPRNLLDTDISCVIGLGTFGKFTKGKVQQHGSQTTGLVQVIADRELERADRKHMLQELDMLIKSSEHENVISLIGISETNTTLFVVLQDYKCSLKEFLLQSRHRDLQHNKFCLLTENKVLQMCVDVARGMEYLHNKKIIHKRVCCRNVVVTEGGAARVAGFGLSLARPLHEVPDYTRWTAHEMLRQTRPRHSPRSDVWSYGVLMWEALTVGATPYFHTNSKEVAGRVLRGMRPGQPSYVGDELFQLCLQCWQVDPDERPPFSALLRDLTPHAAAPGNSLLSFTHYNGFEFDPHVPQHEVNTS